MSEICIHCRHSVLQKVQIHICLLKHNLGCVHSFKFKLNSLSYKICVTFFKVQNCYLFLIFAIEQGVFFSCFIIILESLHSLWNHTKNQAQTTHSPSDNSK